MYPRTNAGPDRRPSKRVLIRLLVILMLVSGLVTSEQLRVAQAAEGDLDPTYGTGGKVSTSFPGGLDTANGVAVQLDGKIVVAGYSGSDFALTRYNTDGSLDSSFGTGGRVNTDFPVNLGGLASAIVIQPDQKIALAGSGTDQATQRSTFALARYNTNGTLDSTFDGDGLVQTTFANSHADGSAIAANSLSLASRFHLR